jgi:hypothetical protein
MTHIFSQAILKGALTPIHLINGITLEELNDEVLALKQNGKIITPYHARDVRVQVIRRNADEFLERIGK